MRATLRKFLLYGALAATLVAVWWSSNLPQKDTEVTAPPPAVAAKSPKSTVRPEPSEPQTRPTERMSVATLDAFATRNWTPPAPPPSRLKFIPPPPPPVPVAPPLPYRYLGKLQESGHLVVFLSNNAQPLLVRGGEVLDQQWRVDEITPRLVRFTFIPLAQSATLTIGDAL